MLFRISVAERGLTGITNIFRSRLSILDDLLRAGTVPLTRVRLSVSLFVCLFVCGHGPDIAPFAITCGPNRGE